MSMLGTDTSGLVVSNNLFAGNSTGGATNGVYVGGNASHGTGIKVVDNTFRDTDDGTGGSTYAIQFNVIQLADDVKDITISGNGSTNDGTFLSLVNVSNTTVTNNSSQQQAENGLMIRDGVISLTISNNQLKDSLNGIWFIGIHGTTDDVTITGNTITGMSQSGILMYDGRDVAAGNDSVSASKNTITGNTVGIDNSSNVSIAADSNYWGCEAGPGAAGCDTNDGLVQASVWYTNADMTATNINNGNADDGDPADDSKVPGVPNTAVANKTVNLIPVIGAAVAAVVAGVVVVRRFATKI
ncbi:MAG: hypothetical protein L0H38_01200 [bacterium]|nr:hypothetical protein [bacterium]